MLKRCFYASLLILGLSYSLWAKPVPSSNGERYGYQYIALLWEKGESDILEREIESFLVQYPNSQYRDYVRFLSANLQLNKGSFRAALETYDVLLFGDLDLETKHQLYLNRALSLYYLKDYSSAMTQIQILDSSTRDTLLLAEASICKARIYNILGQHFGSMRAYQYALEYLDSPLYRYEYLGVLLDQHRTEEAEVELTKLANDENFAVPAYTAYADYLLRSSLMDDFESLIAQKSTLQDELPVKILILRKAFLDKDYRRAEVILNANPQAQDHLYYYRALLAIEMGDTAQADELLADLVKSAEPDLKVLSYLERLKILYLTEPISAMVQLGQYVENPENKIAKAEQHLCLGFFAYQKQDYVEALKQFNLARSESKDQARLAEIDLLVAKSWLKAKRLGSALEAFNRYLNLYPQASHRDEALYYIGFIHHENKDYVLAKTAFSKLLAQHPESENLPSAKFYLAEMDYYLANYTLALNAFLEILEAEPDNSDAALRVAQIYYYMANYDATEHWLQKISPGYDSLILQGHVHFIRKDYPSALQFFSLAERASNKAVQITEAQSYRALCLYQMKRYTEATELYLKLFKGSESPDTYLYLGAKSAYAAGDYHQALRLFDQFIDTYPESQYFLPVLADIANSYYNMGNYEQAVRDYHSILSRFRNVREFSDADRALLGEVFTGLELSLKRADNPALMDETAELSQSFQSLYISFELSYLLIRLYAENDSWQDVLNGAEELRRAFPEVKRNEVEILMAESLIELNELAQADSLLGTLYTDTNDLEALIRWAEIDYLTQDYASALKKYRVAFTNSPGADIWYQMLKASAGIDYQDFDEIWSLGDVYQNEIPASRIVRLTQLMEQNSFDEALLYTDQIINESLNPHDHATAFLHKGLIYFHQERYEAAIPEFNRTLMLFPDLADIRDDAAYHLIVTYIRMGEFSEAEMLLWDMATELSDDHKSAINELMGQGQ